MPQHVRDRTEDGLKALERARSLVKGGADRLKAATARIDETLSETASRRRREAEQEKKR